MASPNPVHQVEALVVGAGMSGLTAAVELQRAGKSVLVLDKGRGVGGRLASRRIGEATFDHGAQFMTARNARFAAQIEEGRQSGVIEEWCRGFAGGADGHPRWRGRPTMASVAKQLAQGMHVILGTEIVALRRIQERWSAESKAGETFKASAVVLTPPVPQSLAVLDAGSISLEPETRACLESIAYERCLAVMVVLEEPSRIPLPGAFAPAEGPIAWIADNRLKGVSAEPAVTIHATDAFSRENWDRDRQETGRQLIEAATGWLGTGIKTFQVHGWRYSKPMHVHDQACVTVSHSPPLVLAGDAFAGPRVEGAALSGWAAAEAVLPLLAIASPNSRKC